MKRLLFSVLVLAGILPVLAQSSDTSKRVTELRRIIAKADQKAAQAIAENSTFMFMNGMLNDIGTSIGKMTDAVRNSEAGKKAADLYHSVHLVDIGTQAPDFTLPTPDGKQIHFYEFIKGKKCVLLDFWASWCGWCRKENPYVKAAYDEYKSLGFDVLSVSVDEKEVAWRKALEEDKPTWSQTVDYRGTKEGLYKWYSLNGIPAIFLIDDQGYILAKGLRGTKISETVKEYITR